VFVNRGWISRTIESWDRPSGIVNVVAFASSVEKVRNLLATVLFEITEQNYFFLLKSLAE
jgi:hypothetical protein